MAQHHTQTRYVDAKDMRIVNAVEKVGPKPAQAISLHCLKTLTSLIMSLNTSQSA